MSTNAVTLANFAPASGYPVFRNRIINGNFDIWQRGTSGFGASVYAADRWQTGGTVTSCLLSTDVPSGIGALNSIEFNGSANVNTRIIQKIESANCLDFVDKPVTLSFWAKNILASPALVVELMYPSAVDNFTTTTLIEAVTVATINNFSTSWTYYTATFSALPSQVANGLLLLIRRTNGVASGTRVAQVQLEVGTVATPFERRPYGLELALCQRYYAKTYSVETTPGTATTTGYVITLSNATGWAYVTWKLPVSMRAAPTVTAYNHSTGASGTWNDGGGVARTLTILSASTENAPVGSTSVNTNSYLTGHLVASAEL